MNLTPIDPQYSVVRVEPETSEPLARYEQLLRLAENVLGSAVRAQQWMHQEQFWLGNQAPADMGQRETEWQAVETLLWRMEHGVYN